jgi:hypothetical protein
MPNFDGANRATTSLRWQSLRIDSVSTAYSCHGLLGTSWKCPLKVTEAFNLRGRQRNIKQAWTSHGYEAVDWDRGRAINCLKTLHVMLANNP